MNPVILIPSIDYNPCNIIIKEEPIVNRRSQESCSTIAWKVASTAGGGWRLLYFRVREIKGEKLRYLEEKS